MGPKDTEGQTMPVCVVLEVRWRKWRVMLTITLCL